MWRAFAFAMALTLPILSSTLLKEELSPQDAYAAEISKNFKLPEQVELYEQLGDDVPATVRALALLLRAKADIPHVIEFQDMDEGIGRGRLSHTGGLSYNDWLNLVNAVNVIEDEMYAVQTEAEKMQKGWGAGVFAQANEMRIQEQQERDEAKIPKHAALSMMFTKSFGSVRILAEGRNVTQQTKLDLLSEYVGQEVPSRFSVKARLTVGRGATAATYSCSTGDITLDTSVGQQWKQIGSDPHGLRLQARFVKRPSSTTDAFVLEDIFATLPKLPKAMPARVEEILKRLTDVVEMRKWAQGKRQKSKDQKEVLPRESDPGGPQAFVQVREANLRDGPGFAVLRRLRTILLR